MVSVTLLPDRGYKLEASGLTITADLSMEDWQKIGRKLVGLREATAWAIGDWLIYGRGEFGETYERAAEITGRSFESLSQYLRVDEAFPPAERFSVSWSKHREALRVSPERRHAVLRRAIENRWTRHQLASHISQVLAPSQVAAVTDTQTASPNQKKSARWRKQRPKEWLKCPSCGHSFQHRPRSASGAFNDPDGLLRSDAG